MSLYGVRNRHYPEIVVQVNENSLLLTSENWEPVVRDVGPWRPIEAGPESPDIQTGHDQ